MGPVSARNRTCGFRRKWHRDLAWQFQVRAQMRSRSILLSGKHAANLFSNKLVSTYCNGYAEHETQTKRPQVGAYTQADLLKPQREPSKPSAAGNARIWEPLWKPKAELVS